MGKVCLPVVTRKQRGRVGMGREGERERSWGLNSPFKALPSVT